MTAAQSGLRIYFSDYFGVSRESVAEYGAFNVSLINDLPLFVDPFLLFNSEEPEYEKLHSDMIKYMLFLKNMSALNLDDATKKIYFYFPEVKENWLGFSKTGNKGRGLAKEFANSLKTNFATVFSSFGDENSATTQLSKLSLVRDGVGRDQISDFTCNLILDFLAGYTQSFAKENIAESKLGEFPIAKAKFNYVTKSWSTRRYILPRFGDEFVLLTPVDILTKDEAWISHHGFVEDFSSVVASIDNDTLRAKIHQYFTSALPIEATKEDRKRAVDSTAIAYPEVLDYYVREQSKHGKEGASKSLKKVDNATYLFGDQLEALAAKLKETAFYDLSANSYDEVHLRVAFLKHIIEECDGYRSFYNREEEPVSLERDLQVMFKLCWFASPFSVDSEVNNGRGPADFVASFGSGDKTVVEFKLAKNTQLEKNLAKQAEIYSAASRATHPSVKVILYFNEDERARVVAILVRLGMQDAKDVILIDGSPKVSASRA